MSEGQSDHLKKCQECDSNTLVQTREYKWYCTPKAKYGEQPYWSLLNVSLCQECYNKTDPNATLRGWDWWDAYDDLHYNYMIQKDEKRHWDTITASILGFESVETLNKARELTRKVIEEEVK